MKIVEVFRTNVATPLEASALIDLVQHTFPRYMATFDLEDCDRILRIATTDQPIRTAALISLLKNAGVHIEILPDEIPPFIDGEILLSTHE